MLKTFRKKGFAKKVLWFVAIVIIISFGFLGRASLLTGRDNHFAGKIFGKKISLSEFRKMYDQAQMQAIMQYGDKFFNIQQYLNLESTTWDRLILLHEANKRNIRVTNKEVIAFIQSIPFFQKDGKFDVRLYNNGLKYAFHMQAREFEEAMRNSLRFDEIRKKETKNISIKDEDVFNDYRRAHEKAQISYIFAASDNFINEVSVNEEEIADYYEKHKQEFLTSPQINVEYLLFKYPPKLTLDNDNTLKEEEKKQAQEKITEEYEGKKADIFYNAQEIYQKLLDDPDFASISLNDVELKTTNFFSMEKPNLALGGSYSILNKLFQFDIGEITEPFETKNGVIIAKLIAKKDSYIPGYAEAKDKAREAVAKIKAKNVAKEKTTEYLKEIKNAWDKTMINDFQKITKTLNLEANQTPIFTRGQYLPQIGISNDFEETAFSLTKENPLSDVVETSSGYAILHLDQYIPVDKEKFEEEKTALKERLLNEKKDIAFKEFLTKLRLNANLQSNLKKEENN